MEEFPIKSGWNINKIHRYVLYLSSLILVFSLFFDTKIVNNAIVQKGAFAFVAISLVWWVIEEIFSVITNYIESIECKWSDKSKKLTANILTFLWYASLFIGIFIGVRLIFPRFLAVMSVWKTGV